MVIPRECLTCYRTLFSYSLTESLKFEEGDSLEANNPLIPVVKFIHSDGSNSSQTENL